MYCGVHPFSMILVEDSRLLAQAELLHDGTIALDVAVVEVVEQGATLAYELGQ